MWCIPKVTDTFIARMEHLIEVYQQPYDPLEPVICFDEKSKQLLEDTRPLLSPTDTGQPIRRDYEYRRNGTVNLFLSVEPKGGYREVTVTDRRTKQDFAGEIKRLSELPRYQSAKKLHIVLDNLNTHFETSLQETFGSSVTKRLMERIEFHYTPTHGSWLNMAEIELSILGRQCVNRRLPTKERVVRETSAWQAFRNDRQATLQWKFTTRDARNVFKEYYENLVE